MIKAVIFDLDGTLLDRDSSLQSFVANQYDRLATSLGHIERQSYIRRFIELDCRGHVWKDEVYQSLIEEFEIAQVSWQFLLDDYETKFINHCIPTPAPELVPSPQPVVFEEPEEEEIVPVTVFVCTSDGLDTSRAFKFILLAATSLTTSSKYSKEYMNFQQICMEDVIGQMFSQK